MANEQNLIPFDERTESERREIGRLGGIASGAARRRKRSLKEAADLLLSLPVSDRKVLKKLTDMGIAQEDADNQMAMVCGLHAKAVLGDAKAAKVIVDLLGESGECSAPMADDGFLEALREEAASVWQDE